MYSKKKILLIVLTFLSGVEPVLHLTAESASAKLVQLVSNGTAGEIKKTIETNSDLVTITTGSDRETLLMVAAKNNRPNDIITLLLKAGVDPDKKTKSGKTALMFACEFEQDMSAVESLITSGSFFSFVRKGRVLVKDKTGKTAFDYAKLNTAQAEISAVLVKYADDPSIKEEKKETSDTSKASVTSDTIIKQDTDEPKEENPPPDEQKDDTAAKITPAETTSSITPSVPVASKDTPVPPVQPYQKVYLFDSNELSNDDTTPLPPDIETNNDNKPVFISQPNARDTFGRTLLMNAVKNGDSTLISSLLYSGADIQATDAEGWTALMYAARYQNNPEIITMLLKYGAVVSSRNKYGITALQLAAGFSDNPLVVTELLKNRSIAEEEVRRSFIYAITTESSPSILQAFLDQGISLNTPYEGKTPLMYAADTNHTTTVIAWLLEHGSKTGYRTSEGLSAFDFAQKNKRIPHDQVYWSLNTTQNGQGAN